MMKIIIWILALIPIVYMSFRYSFEFGWHWLYVVVDFVHKHFGVYLGESLSHPVTFLQDTTAKTALNMFIVVLALQPLYAYLKINLLKYRRMIGLFGFFYAALHVMIFIAIKHNFHLDEVYAAAKEHIFIVFGMMAFVIFSIMAVTSMDFLYKRFASWHKLFYLAMIFIIIHFLFAHKTISLEFIVYTIIISTFLALRLVKSG